MKRLFFLPVVLVVLVSMVGGISAQMPADSVFSGFVPNGEFLFELGGQDLSHAEVFHSERAGAFLIMAPELSSPVLLGTRTGTVESVHLMKVARRGDGTVDLLADATFDQSGRFRLEGQEVVFDVKGQAAKLKRKPDLIGFHKPDKLRDYKSDYAYRADQYTPSPTDVKALKAVSKDVKVLIYFGSWCPTCSRLVPNVIKVNEELAGSKVQFQYYGLPHQMNTDPRTSQDKIKGVPTGIVYVGGKEVGRLGVKELASPESAIRSLVGG